MTDYTNMSIYERIKFLRKNILNLTQEDFASAIGVSRSNIGNIEVGRINVTDRVISDICDKYNVSDVWLKTGAGDMFIQTPNTLLDELAKMHNLNDVEKAIIETFISLSPESRRGVIDYITKANDIINKNTEKAGVSFEKVVQQDMEYTDEMLKNIQKIKK